MKLNITEGAAGITDRLNKAGYRAYIAGSTVRELLLSMTPNCYEIVTNAAPENIKSLFRHTIDAGIGNNTITVVENKTGYEVTSMYCDNAADDGRCADEERGELCRQRDFTINAVLYNPNEGIVDYYGGRQDMADSLIRCVGDPEQCFRADALGMLRAVRLSAVLDFKIEQQTERAIRKCAVLIKKADHGKIRDELNKILLSKHPDKIRELHRLGLLRFIIPELERCFGEPQKNKYHIYDVGEHIMHTVINTPPDLVLRWSALLHDTGKPCCPSTDANGIIHFYGHHRESRRISVDVLHRLRMDADMIKDIAMLVENHDYRVDANYTAVKRMMSKTGAELFEKLLILQKADNMAKNPAHLPDKLKRIECGLGIYRQVIARKQPYRISDLAVNTRDLINIGVRQGREAGDMLKALLDEVIIKPELNTHAYLLKRAKEIRRGRK
ncbi:MAG: CCA tRNA nucleotidyltransferase [Clostridiales bacterium]|nr:CCA tRNA nucleotidyltransferase [Clostridiales bacterium]